MTPALFVLVLMMSPDGARWRVAEVALPAGTALVACQSGAAQVPAMIAAEQSTGWRAWAAKCTIRERA